MERGNSKHSPRLDDQMEREVEALVHGQPVPDGAHPVVGELVLLAVEVDVGEDHVITHPLEEHYGSQRRHGRINLIPILLQ